jgi:predicted metal-binding protein
MLQYTPLKTQLESRTGKAMAVAHCEGCGRKVPDRIRKLKKSNEERMRNLDG